jgi:hypothetical protein
VVGDSVCDLYLVTVNDSSHGRIRFAIPCWRSRGVQPISISLRGSRYEAMLLMGQSDWLETDLGRWSVSPQSLRLVLAEEGAL